jgi:hypothetical protein
MTITLEIRAARLADIAAELATPTITLDHLANDPAGAERLRPETASHWAQLQHLVAESIAARRHVTTEPEVSRYVAAVVRHLTYWWDELGHSAADGPTFRSGMTDDVAADLGLELTAGLVRRPFVGLVADAHPYTGWATHQELAATVAARSAAVVGQREHQTAELRSMLTSIHAAVDKGYDLVTIYDDVE